MACKSVTEEYTAIVLNLIKSDPKYRNYDNAVSIVLNNDVLDVDQKKSAIHHFAKIYEGLIELDNKAYQGGKLQRVLDVQIQFDDTKKYLASISDIYKEDTAISNRQKKANDLASELEAKLAKAKEDQKEATGVNKVMLVEEITRLERDLKEVKQIGLPNPSIKKEDESFFSPVKIQGDTYIIFKDRDRQYTRVLIDGKQHLFYRSSSGTEGKIPGNWYYTLGNTEEWVVKGGWKDGKQGGTWIQNPAASPELEAKLNEAAERLNKSYSSKKLSSSKVPTVTLKGQNLLDALGSPINYKTRYKSNATAYKAAMLKAAGEDAVVSSSIKPVVNSKGEINIYASTKENAHLSNFAIRPFKYEGIQFQSVEQAFQYIKVKKYTNAYSIDPSVEDQSTELALNQAKIDDHLRKILAADSATAKRLGKQNIGVDFEVELWDMNSSEVMKKLLLESFKQNKDAASNLLATGTTKLTHTQDKSKWGTEFPKLLMEVRTELSKEDKDEYNDNDDAITTPEEQLYSEIGKLAEQEAIITLKQLNKVFELMDNYYNTLMFDSQDALTEDLKKISRMIYDAVDSAKGTAEYKNGLKKKIVKKFESIAFGTEYIDVNQFSDRFAAKNRLWIELKDGQVIQGLELDGVTHMYDFENQTYGAVIPEEEIAVKKTIRNLSQPTVNYENGMTVIYPAQLPAGFTVRPIDSEESGQLFEELEKVNLSSNTVEIKAVRISEVGDQRVQELHRIAEEESKFSSLKNRTFETFETPEQTALLQKEKDAKIITVRRPNKSDQIAFVGRLKGSDIRFNLFNFDNYTIVDANNNTTAFDFNNPDHIKLFKEKVILSIYNNDLSVSNEHMDQMIKASKQFQEFKQKAVAALGTNSSIDVTELFLAEYQGELARVDAGSINLEEMLKRDDALSLPVTLVTVDKKGNVIKDSLIENYKLPAHFTKRFDYETGKFKYTIKSTLPANKRVLDRTGEPVDDITFFTEYFQKDNDTFSWNELLDPIFRHEYENINVKGTHYAPRFLLRFQTKKGGLGYQAVNYISYAHFGYNFAEWAYKFITLDSMKPGEVKQFDKDYTFNYLNIKDKSYAALRANLAANVFKNEKGEVTGSVLNLEIRSAGIDGITTELDEYVNGKNFRREYNINLLSTKNKPGIQEALQIRLKEIEENYFPAAEIALGYDATEDNKLEFIKDVYESYNELKEDAPGAIVSLVDRLDRLSVDFTNSVAELVDNTIKENFQAFIDAQAEEGSTKLLDSLKKYYTFENEGNSLDDYNFKRLIAAENAGVYLNVKQKASAPFAKTAKFISVPQIHRAQFIINSKRNSKINQSVNYVKPEVVDNSEQLSKTEQAAQGWLDSFGKPESEQDQKIADAVKEQGKKAGRRKKVKTKKVDPSEGTNVKPTDKKDKPGSIDPSGEGVEVFQAGEDIVDTTLMQLPEAEKWLAEALPQLGLEKSDLKDVIDLTTINGNVLGIYKDKVIHLNKQLGGAATLYHEAFHGVFRHLMDSQKRRELLDIVIGNTKYAAQFTKPALDKFARDRNYNLSYEELRNLVAEEILADGFRDYMINKTKPKGLLARFFEMLKKLLRFFSKNSRIIDEYKKIADGRYSGREIQSGMYDGQYALQSIPGLVRHYEDELGYAPAQTQEGGLSSSQQRKFVNLVTKYILTDETEDSFDDKFNRAADSLIELYDIEKRVEEKPGFEAEIRKEYTNIYNVYRFMLGARMNEEKYGPTPDENRSDNEKYNNLRFKQVIDLGNGKLVENTDGSYSKKILKKLVQENYNAITALEIEDEDIDDLEQVAEGELDSQKDTDQNLKSDQEESPDSFDEGYGQQDVLNQVKYVRTMLATIEVMEEDRFGLKMPTVVDAVGIFPVLLKLTSGLNPNNTIQRLQAIGEIMKYNNFKDTALYVDAIYNEIKEKTGLNENGQPTKNSHIYDMFVEVLDNVELDHTMFEIQIPSEEMAMGPYRVDVKDSVLTTDIQNKKNDIISGILSKFTDTKDDAVRKHKESVTALVKLSKDIVKSSQTAPLFTGKANQVKKQVEEKTEELHGLLKDIGIDLPKSLVKMSLLGIEVEENERSIPTAKDLAEFYDLHEDFIKEKKYLEKDFFRDIPAIARQMYQEGTGSKRVNQFVEFMDENISKRGNADYKNKDRFLSILKNSTHYILKYDPQKIQSVIKNAEGKNIYRYAKKNPLIQMADIVRQDGLLSMLSIDPFFEMNLKDYMMDNPVVGKYLDKIINNKELDNEDKEVETYLNNLNLSMLGGVKQRVGDKLKEGKSFKNIDPKSLYLIYLASFMTRETAVVTDAVVEEGQELPRVTMFKKQFHQLESTQTNFLMNTLYKSFINTSDYKNATNKKAQKGYRLYEGRYHAIVEDLLGIIKQEYNRIAREKNSVDAKLANYNSNTKNELILKYNAKYNADGSIDTTSPDLRAFKFNRLQQFWANRPNLRDSLIAQAASQESFDEMDKADLKNLKAQLDIYVDAEFQNHIRKMENLGVISTRTVEIKNDKGEVIDKLNEISSKYLPRVIKTDFKSTDVRELYASPRYAEDTGMSNFIYDAFMNHWYGTLMFNQIFDGDIAMGTKNDTDYVKRLKKYAAAGSNMKNGKHTVAIVNTIEAWSHDAHPEYGPYMNEAEIMNDVAITEAIVKDILLRDFRSDTENRYKEDKDIKKFGAWYPIFDGQSISSLQHQMMQYKTFGRLSPKVTDILIAKHYRPLTKAEMAELKKMRIANNSKKTVTASRYNYLKLSEYFIDRNDVSYLYVPGQEGMSEEQRVDAHKIAQEQIHSMYSEIWKLKLDIDQAQNQNLEGEIPAIRDRITELTAEIHKFFKPIKSRRTLHNLLNTMEYQQIDQMMDTEASKNASLLPTDIMKSGTDENGHFNLKIASQEVPNLFKYLQVETSGVKEKAKVGVQKKVLLPADVPMLLEMLEQEKKDKKLTDEEKASLTALGNALTAYNTTLNETTKARFEYLRNIIREGDENLDITKMYKIIQQSLIDQGADTNQIKLFDIKPDGKPAINQNLPLVRKMVEYFFFNHYSQHVTDEKAAGFKSFHISQWGWNVLVDKDNNVITTEEYLKDPAKYAGDQYQTRPLGVSVEVDPETGVKTYWTEVMVPMPMFDTVEEKEFYMEFMRKAFGTRIPTEDKRSMIAMKIVDFIDSSKLNTVIVPQYVHILAGSDFDIDSLFGQSYSTYQNVLGQTIKYGDTSMYQTKEAGEFVEFLEYMASKPEFKKIIDKKRAELRREVDDTFEDDEQLRVLRFGAGSAIQTLLQDAHGLTDEEIEQLKFLQDDVEYLYKTAEEAQTLWDEVGGIFKDIEKETNFYRLKELHKQKKDKIRQQRAKAAEAHETKQLLSGTNKMMQYVYHYQPIIETLSEFAIPITFDSYKTESVYGAMVAPRYQNANLEAALAMLSNEHIFKRLYINQKTSGKLFEDLLKQNYGFTVKEYIQKGDINTIDSMVDSKEETGSSKDGIGIAANTNKFLSVSSTYELELLDNAAIWKYNKRTINQDGSVTHTPTSHKVFHKLNEQQQRSIEIVGSILGVFADGAKDPLPAAMQLNEVNTNTALSMAALGLNSGLVIGIGFMPEVKSAVTKVLESKTAISDDFIQETVWFNGAITDEIKNIVGTESSSGWMNYNEVLPELQKAGLIKPPKGKSLTYKNFSITNSNLVIDYNAPGTLDLKKLKNSMLSLKEIGIYVGTTTPGVELSEEAQKVILLKMYADQISQGWQIKKAGNLTNFHKKINPNIPQFDKVHEGIEWLNSEGTIFTEDSMNRMLSEDSVYGTIKEISQDMVNQLDNLFLERQEVFSEIRKHFGKIFMDPSKMSDVFVGSISVQAYINKLLTIDTEGFSEIRKTNTELEQQDIRELLNPDSLFYGTLAKELSMMQSKYPGNSFLSKLRPQKGNASVFAVDNSGKKYELREQNVTLIDKIKLKGELLADVRKDLNDLFASGLQAKRFVKKLFISELLRTGGQIHGVKGSFIGIMPASLLIDYSQSTQEVLDQLTNINKVIETSDVLDEDGKVVRGRWFVNGKYYKTEKGAEKYLNKNWLSPAGILNGLTGQQDGMTNVIEKIVRAAIADPMNTKIPSVQSIKTYIDTKTGEKHSAFVKGVIEKYGTTENLAQNVYKEINELTSLQLKTPTARVDITNPTQFHKIDPDILTIKAGSNERLNRAIADMLGVFAQKGKDYLEIVNKNEKGEDEVIGVEEVRVDVIPFPLVRRVGQNYYQLRTVDGMTITDMASAYNGVISTTGKVGVYEKVDMSFKQATSNQLGWTTEAIRRYAAVLNNTNQINIENQIKENQETLEPVEQTSVTIEKRKKFTREQVKNETDKVFLFGDNFEDSKTGYVPRKTQAVIRGLENAIGISTKKNRFKREDSYLTNADFEMFVEHVNEQINKAIASGKTIVIPEDGIGTGAANFSDPQRSRLRNFLNGKLLQLEQGVQGGIQDEKYFEWNRPSRGRGTDADVAMRDVADGFIGQISEIGGMKIGLNEYANLPDEAKTSTTTSAFVISKKIGKSKKTGKYGIQLAPDKQTIALAPQNLGPETVIMLARNGYYKDHVVSKDMKDAILLAYSMGAQFVLGNMDRVDTQMQNFLTQIGASYTIYGHERNKKEVDPKAIITEGNITYTKDINVLRKLHNTKQGIYTLRVSQKQFEAKLAPAGLSHEFHFGNPWTGTAKEGAIKVKNIEEAVNNYEDWLDGKAHQEIEPQRRKWINEAIAVLKKRANVKLAYHTRGYRSHADVLNEKISGEKSKRIIKTPMKVKINKTDIAKYNSYLKKSGGKKPYKFFGGDTIFREFYNESTGKYEKQPQYTSWILNGNGFYDLVDIRPTEDGGTGEIYITNVDLKSGVQYEVTLPEEEMQPETSIQLEYTPKGKATQTYTIKGTQIFNKDGKEVFQADNIDRQKIFANLAVKEGTAKVVQIEEKVKGELVKNSYVVFNDNTVMSVISGRKITKEDIIAKAVAAADVMRANMAKGNPNNLNKPDQEDMNNCK